MDKWTFMNNPFGEVRLEIYLKRNKITVLSGKGGTCYEGDRDGAIRFIDSVIKLFLSDSLIKTTIVFQLHYQDIVEAMSGALVPS